MGVVLVLEFYNLYHLAYSPQETLMVELLHWLEHRAALSEVPEVPQCWENFPPMRCQLLDLVFPLHLTSISECFKINLGATVDRKVYLVLFESLS